MKDEFGTLELKPGTPLVELRRLLEDKATITRQQHSKALIQPSENKMQKNNLFKVPVLVTKSI